jgi:type II secretory pathway component GspD/PulD (secretin)
MSVRRYGFVLTVTVLFASAAAALATPQEPPPSPPPAFQKEAPATGPEVAVEVRLMTLSDAAWQRLGQLLAQWSPGQVQPNPVTNSAMFLNERQLTEFMTTAQSDSQSSILQAPKMTMMNGQTGSFATSDEQFFVTNVNVVQVGGQQVFVPKNEPLKTGMSLAVTPTVSADRRFVRAAIRADVTQFDSAAVPLYPVVTYVAPVFEGGAVGQPVPFTQYIQQPKLSSVHRELTVNVPDSGSVLVYGWRKPAANSQSTDTPVLSKIPYVNRLLKTVGYTAENENVLLMVTPRIVVNEEDEQRIVAETLPPARAGTPLTSKSQRKVAELLGQYHLACSEGRLDDAKKVARKALALDPTCFSQNDKVPQQPVQR